MVVLAAVMFLFDKLREKGPAPRPRGRVLCVPRILAAGGGRCCERAPLCPGFAARRGSSDRPRVWSEGFKGGGETLTR